MYGYPPYGYPPPQPTSPTEDPVKAAKRWLKFVKQMEIGKVDGTNIKKKDEPKKHKTFSTGEAFMLLTIFSPIVGPLYLLMMITIAKHSAELLQTLLK